MTEAVTDNAQHTSKTFESRLEEINNSIIEMGDILKTMIGYVRKSFSEGSKKVAQDAKQLDKKLNALDFDVQQRATTMIALRQPMGVDLRFLVAVLKISSSLERMGDLAKSSCRKAARFGDDVSDDISEDLIEMTDLAAKMLENTIISFKEKSAAKANEVLDMDDDMDDLYHQLLKDIEKSVAKKPKLIEHFADIVFAAKNMERIGDHCTKTADLVHYVASGEHVGKIANAKEQLADSKK